jgi:hypothetical protein
MCCARLHSSAWTTEAHRPYLGKPNAIGHFGILELYKEMARQRVNAPSRATEGQVPMPPKSTATHCSIGGCTNPPKARGWCSSHYMRWFRYGDPLESRFLPPVVERFWSRVDKTHEDGCWLWKGSDSRSGYGYLRVDGRQIGAHCYSYQLHIGPIPTGLQIDHLCRSRACVNPDHLEAVTTRENVLRGVGITAQNAKRTHCIHGHEFTPGNTLVSHEGQRRSCRECKRLRSQQRRRREKGYES